MPYTSKEIITDARAKPIPQFFNPTSDQFEPIYGRNGAHRVELYDASGNPINTSNGNIGVQINGSLMDLRGLASEKPSASADNKGKTYWSIDTGAVEVSTGTAWKAV